MCEVESSVFTTPGVSPVAEYDVGRLYWTCGLETAFPEI